MDIPSVADVCVGTVCDLAPWNDRALELFQNTRSSAPLDPIILYVPEENLEFATELKTLDPAVRCCVQDPSVDALERLRDSLNWLIESGASSSLIELILEGRAPVNPTSLEFLQWAVRAIGTRCGHPVTDGADALGISSRTLGRRLTESHFPPPVETYSWVKLLAVAWRADTCQATLGRAARIFHLDSVRLYQLKQRLLDESQIQTVRSSDRKLPIILAAFRERCRAIEGTNLRLSGQLM